MIQNTRGVDHPNSVLFLNDRSRSPLFWSHSLDNAILFQRKDVAEKIASKLKYNNPRVVSYNETRKLEADNFCHESMHDDQSWGSHELWY